MRILYIRVLTACNAGCYMCNYRFSDDSYRLKTKEYEALLNAAKRSGYGWIRFTGGEPLLHERIVDFVQMATDMGINTSIISNGILAEEKMPLLVDAGLKQIIFSIDGLSEIHDKIRAHKGLFQQDMKWIKYLKEKGIITRVNTIIARNNYRDLPKMRKLFDKIKLDFWEVSPVKLDRAQPYTDGEKEELKQIIVDLFDEKYRLKPMGIPWLTSEQECIDFFENNIMPHNYEHCYVVDDVRFYDGYNKLLFPCNTFPHRNKDDCVSVDLENGDFLDLDSEKMLRIAKHYREGGCKECRGCSTPAKNYVRSEGINY